MKYYIVTSNPRFKTVFSNHLAKKKIVYKLLDNEDGIISEISSRGRKTFYLDHDFSLLPPENVVQLIMKSSSDNIVITFGGERAREDIIALFRAGVKDIFMEPFIPSEIIDLSMMIKKDSDSKVKQDAQRDEKSEPDKNYSSENMVKPIGSSKIFKSLMIFVERVAGSDATIMITGESGTGKEVVSQYIHSLSERKASHFVPVNCGAIPENLLESEFFGYVKGAFTGAFTDRKGRFETAKDGTIFLDEIGELPLHLQVKLLRVLQEKEIQPVGSNDIISINPRIITATNKNLEDEMRTGNFREDLFYRLNVIPIHIPPLRHRADDVPELAQFFIKKYNLKHKKKISGVSDECMEKLMDYDWPGNIRELENSIERMVVIRPEGVLEVEDLPPKLSGVEGNPLAFLLGMDDALEVKPVDDKKNKKSSKVTDIQSIDWDNIELFDGFDMKTFLETVEVGLIKKAMQETEKNKNQAAKYLGLNRTTLIEKIKKKNLNF